ncbi:MAG: formylglycine-generating enzyme family protein [Pirellulaceae bacterium]|nr:formylglycine-generating enzyme family protein [Pirellulaceae bacterium]
MRFQIVAAGLLTALSILIAAPAANADSPAKTRPGIAKEEPADGPSVEVADGFMVPFSVTIPGTDVSFEMVPVPGGTYTMGSPDTEEGRRKDEGPQVKVTVDPMWVAKTEVTWAQYKEFMNLYDAFKKFDADGIRKIDAKNQADVITAPTPLYDASYTFEYGEEAQQPAVTMSQYSAQQFTKWLSRLTDLQLRLPTEAEWEYAARSGTTTAYSFGDSADDIDDYAWFFDNADEGAGFVGTKKPNAFGLHDMHGNAAEWTINQHTPDGYRRYVGKDNRAVDMAVWPTEEDRCVVRGGSWEMDPPELRSASRLVSNYLLWKDIDPQIPKSPWWITDDPSRGIGFRVFQSYNPLPKEKIDRFWEANSEEVLYQVKFKLDEGRGTRGVVDKTLPDAIEAIDE